MVDAGEGEGMTGDVEWVGEELDDPLLGLPPPHLASWQFVFRACTVVTQLTIETR